MMVSLAHVSITPLMSLDFLPGVIVRSHSAAVRVLKATKGGNRVYNSFFAHNVLQNSLGGKQRSTDLTFESKFYFSHKVM